ncbi:MAG: lipopolysaccharide assembly protein LapA domain-containing protein [Gordonia sp. (in: high G+C Gram-positive bacteria)]|uniref:LapA family protein n=1 Tax=Gordonia sp. (in: high G+C Gram-positive bacteria) TaxID=84139 RepID=UPI0039E5D896
MSTPETHDDPAAVPAPRVPAPVDDASGPERRALSEARRQVRSVAHTRSRATYFGWVVGIVVTILLLVFILRNQGSQDIDLLFWKVRLPVGVSLLIAALLGAIITLAISAARIMELRRALNRVDKARRNAAAK